MRWTPAARPSRPILMRSDTGSLALAPLLLVSRVGRTQLADLIDHDHEIGQLVRGAAAVVPRDVLDPFRPQESKPAIDLPAHPLEPRDARRKSGHDRDPQVRDLLEDPELNAALQISQCEIQVVGIESRNQRDQDLTEEPALPIVRRATDEQMRQGRQIHPEGAQTRLPQRDRKRHPLHMPAPRSTGKRPIAQPIGQPCHAQLGPEQPAVVPDPRPAVQGLLKPLAVDLGNGRTDGHHPRELPHASALPRPPEPRPVILPRQLHQSARGARRDAQLPPGPSPEHRDHRQQHEPGQDPHVPNGAGHDHLDRASWACGWIPFVRGRLRN